RHVAERRGDVPVGDVEVRLRAVANGFDEVLFMLGVMLCVWTRRARVELFALGAEGAPGGVADHDIPLGAINGRSLRLAFERILVPYPPLVPHGWAGVIPDSARCVRPSLRVVEPQLAAAGRDRHRPVGKRPLLGLEGCGQGSARVVEPMHAVITEI